MQINNSCHKLPLGALWHIRRSISWINQADLKGIAFIQLAEQMPVPTERSQDWHKRAYAEGFSVNGLYVSRSGRVPAHIYLFIRDMYRGIPFFHKWSTVTTLNICRTIAHEVGHHLITHRGYIYQPDEKYKDVESVEAMADRYAFDVLKKMRERWYYRLGHKSIKHIAISHYIKGMLNWRDKNYEKAAENWYNSFHLDPDRQDSSYWYWRAKEKIISRESS
jgi:hypothetical protein